MRGVLLHPREWRHKKINGLYMDCNSLIYESIQGVQQSIDNAMATTMATKKERERGANLSTHALYKLVAEQVCHRIESLVQDIAPQEFVYIAFDGIAPYAKMQHQRTRRYRGDFIDRMAKNGKKSLDGSLLKSDVRSVIGTPTPGTPFMVWFSEHVQEHFRRYRLRHPGVTVLLSTSESEVGEGEQKLFDHARQQKALYKDFAVYGLDADLFMLCLAHSGVYGRFHVVREAPEFIKSLRCELEPNVLYMLDMQQFAHSVSQEMRLPAAVASGASKERKIMDYVFLCFLLGNDFLPKFPAVNIRAQGIQILLDVYRDYWRTRGGGGGSHPSHGFLTYWHDKSSTWRIHWGNFAAYIARLAAEEPAAYRREHRRIVEQMARREKCNPLGEFSWVPPPPSPSVAAASTASTASTNKDEDPHDFNLIPQSYRQKELYINPEVAGWQSRYYETLFASVSLDLDQEVIIPYLRTLAWTLQYYTGTCHNWRWGYTPYHYAPLLQDLSAFLQQDLWKQMTPKQRDVMMTDAAALHRLPPFSVQEQLAYVIPPTGEDGDVPRIQLRDFEWAYCQYFWEAHIHFEDDLSPRHVCST